jgi:histidinol-phosphatase (PHP family)
LKPEDLESIYMEFLTTAADLKSKYQDQINLLIGIETDFVTPIDLQRTKALLDSRQDIQYVVGSVHHVAGVSIDFDKSTYIRSVEHCANGTMGSTMVSCSSSSSSSSSDPEWEMPAPRNPDHVPSDEELELFLTKYLDAQYEMIDALEPEVIGHFDLCLLFNPGYRLDGSGREVIWDKVKRNVRKVVEYGGLFEANGAALRKGWETSYPSKEVLQVSSRADALE